MLWTLIKTVPASAVSWKGGPSAPDGIECVWALTVALPTKVNATRTTRHRSSTERIAIGYSITLSFSIRPAHEAAQRYQIQLLVGRRRIALTAEKRSARST